MDEIRPVVGEEWHTPEQGVAQTVVAPHSIQLTRRVLGWLLVGAAVFFIGAVGFFSFYFFVGSGASSTARNIDINISGPTQIAGGEPVQIQIVVTNRNNLALQLADLVISYPPGTRSPTDLSTDLTTQRISLGTIEAGGRRQGTISAIFAGTGGDVQISVDLEYRLTGSSAIFVASSLYQTELSSSPLSISIDGNTETISGQPVEFIVTVASNANTAVRDVLFTTSYPFGFTLGSTNPKAARAIDGGHVWELGDIAPGQKREITIRGTQVGESADERVFRYSVGTRKNPEDETITTVLADASFNLKISDVFLGLAIAINKSSGGDVVVTPDGRANVLINWQNNLPTSIQDAVIVAKLSGIPIDGESFISSDGFYRSSDGVVLWDKTTTQGVFSNIAAGDRGSVSFSFEIPSSEALAGIRNPSITISVNAAGKRISESGVPENLQATASQKIVVASDLAMVAQGLYYANPFGSSGPLPPQADVETTYAIVFTLTNTTNKVEGGKLTATLPPYVRWVGIYSPASETLTFNQSNSTVSWDVGTIEPGAGLNGSSPRQAAIAIGFTPSTSQIGQEPVLLQGISFTGTDASTGAEISRSASDVTTNILGDPGFSATGATVVR